GRRGRTRMYRQHDWDKIVSQCKHQQHDTGQASEDALSAGGSGPGHESSWARLEDTSHARCYRASIPYAKPPAGAMYQLMTTPPHPEATWIDRRETLEAWFDAVVDGDIVGLDTEFTRRN